MIRIAALLALSMASSVIAAPSAHASAAVTRVDSAQSTPPAPPPSVAAPAEKGDQAEKEVRTISIEDEVLGNLKAQPIGPATLGDLALPDDFLKRIGDRVIRSSFEDRYRIVVPDPKPEDATKPADAAQGTTTTVVTTSSSSARRLGLPIGTGIFVVLLAALVLARRRRSRGCP